MRPLTRVLAAAVLAGASLGAVALRPASATSSITDVARPTESSAQSAAVAEAHAAQRARAAQSAAALRASRALAARRHAAYVRSLAAQRHAAYLRSLARQAALAAAPVPAATRTVTRTAAPVVRAAETQVQRGQRLYRAMGYDVTRLGYAIRFLPGRAGLLGLTDSGTRTVTVYVRSSTSDLVLRHTIAHEIGHALDFSRGTATRHSQFLLVRGLGSVEWFGCARCTDYATPAGDWAEVFAQWLAGPGDFRSQMAGVPSAAQLTRLDPLFRL